MATTPGRPVARRAIRSAFSIASAPLLTKNTRSSGSGAKAASRSAASSRIFNATILLW